MKRHLLRAILVLYPRSWRQRYGQELKDLCDDLDRHGERSATRLMLSLIAGAAEERVGVLRTPRVTVTTVAVVGAALAAVAFITVSAAGDTTTKSTVTALQANTNPTPVTTNGPRVSYGNPSPAIEKQLRADVESICAQIAAGQITATRTATAIELNPNNGVIVGKIVQTCDGPA